MLQSSIPEFQHKEHKEWLDKIDFYQLQINVFQKELSMVLHQHFDLFSIIEHVDEYREILLKKLTLLDEMRRQIILHEKSIAQSEKSEKMEAINVWDHFELRVRMGEFEETYKELKESFRKFVAHNISLGKKV